jgi:hypothetical protein
MSLILLLFVATASCPAAELAAFKGSKAVTAEKKRNTYP